jgi:LacI family transcriptional regulator, galactose operon repressor
MVTLKDIASAVGVSTATVSRVLNFDASLSISDKKRKAIIETAESLNYATPRARQRSGRNGLSRIALLHFLRPDQELVDPYYIGLRLGIERRCQALKIEAVKVYRINDRPDAGLLQSAEGAIAIGPHDAAEIDWLSQTAGHLVFADFAPPCERFDSVRCDLVRATGKLLIALCAAGYRRIGFIGWTESGRSAELDDEQRLRTYRAWAAAHGGFDASIVGVAGNSEQDGYRLTRELLSRPGRPEAIVAGNDNMAVGAYRAIAERGLTIPAGIAVASFNDISAAQFLHPPLTTVHLPAEEIGETAVDLLVERALGRELAKQITLASSLRWRLSTRPLPQDFAGL